MNCEKCTAPETNCEYWVGTHCALDYSFSYGFEIGGETTKITIDTGFD